MSVYKGAIFVAGGQGRTGLPTNGTGDVDDAAEGQRDQGHGGRCEETAQVFGSVLKAFALHLARNGLTLDDVSRKAGVTLPPAGALYSRFLSLNDYAHLLEFGARMLKDDYIGVRCSGLPDGGAMHPLMLAIAYAPTPKVAFEVIAAHHRSLIDLADCTARTSGKRTELVWRLSPRIVLRDQLADRIAAALAVRLSTALGPDVMRLAEFRIARSKPADLKLHRQVFGASLAFDAPYNSVSLPVDQAERALPRHDPALFSALVELAQRRTADRSQVTGVAGLVGEEIAQNLSKADLSLEMVARTLGVSARVLQRRLSEQGQSFQELYDQVRRETAADLLRNTSLPISEIAFRLGFSAVGNFTRAAKRWFGTTPSQWRHSGD
nr:helix-turn-helix domain-containing protein [Pannonibacter sp. XCT-34]